MLLLRLIELMVLYNNVRAEMEGHVVGGERVAIEKYPHSVFLDIATGSKDGSSWSCGGSIVNQHFTLTAAHCLEHCTKKGFISVSVGDEHKHRGVKSSAFKIKSHKDYNDFFLNADIGLVRLKTPLKLGRNIQRVILMRNPPPVKDAYVAGWGLIDENYGMTTSWLKHAKQPLWAEKNCRNLLGDIPDSTICAGIKSGKNYAAVGDSGSALVINGNIQIGIVSFKIPHISESVVLYTNVARYYDWILKSTKSMICGK